MSVQGGVWNFGGKPANREFLNKVSQSTAQYGPDGNHAYFEGSIGIFYRPFHTTSESHAERQPYVSDRGYVLTWDGRLDNRDELIRLLKNEFYDTHTDPAIVMAAYSCWGTNCFGKLIGDWALALWNHEERVLILAKDFIGTRNLYYELKHDNIFWCTLLEPMVVLSPHRLEINGEYVAGYLHFAPTAHLTPYVGIDSVPPGAFVQIRSGKATAHVHWNFDPRNKIRYRTDIQYEDHFREVFKQAVARRLRADTPILSELSGGMDSSSIVCMADTLISEGKSDAPRLDTISYYDDEEPNWDERTYFTKVEEKRGRVGTHVDASSLQGLETLDCNHFAAIPGASQNVVEFDKKRNTCMKTNGNRVLLSGIGGDEITGGVPNPIPELADLLVQLRLVRFARQLKAWSLAKRRPWTHLFVEVMGVFGIGRILRHLSHSDIQPPAPWLEPRFVERHLSSLSEIDLRIQSSYPLPSQAVFLGTMTRLRNQIGCSRVPLEETFEVRYPYLDRDLCDFFFSIPREQRVRPGQRRSLTRRSLAQLVPTEILQRKRKAYIIRRPLAVLAEEWRNLQILFQHPLCGQLGFIEPALFSKALFEAMHGNYRHFRCLHNTLKLEAWLLTLQTRGLLPGARGPSVMT